MGIQIKMSMEYSSLFLRRKKKHKPPDFCCIEESVLCLFLPLCLETQSGCETLLENLDTTQVQNTDKE